MISGPEIFDSHLVLTSAIALITIFKTKGLEMKKVNAFLREARIKRGLTQDEVGRFCGYNSQYVSNWERGDCGIPAKAVPKLCKILGVDPYEIIKLMLLDKEAELIKKFKLK